MYEKSEGYETEWQAYLAAKYTNNNSDLAEAFADTCEVEYERTSEFYKTTAPTIRRQRSRQRRRLRWGRLIAVAVIAVALVGVGISDHAWLGNLLQQPLTASAAALTTDPEIGSAQAILVDSEGDVVWSKNFDERIYPASLTKIMTALVALEHLPDLDQTITISDEHFPSLYTEHASVAGFQPGDQVSVRDLLYGVMLPSGAECSLALADEVAGSEAAFVLMMNQLAEDLGMNDTHFTNCTGLQERQHYTTAADLVKLLKFALEDHKFRSIFTTDSYTATNGLEMVSTLSQRLDSNKISDGKILGGKTGYTTEAGYNLATLAVKNGQEYLLVTCGAATEEQPQTDAITLYNAI